MNDFVKNQEDNMNKHQIKSKSSLAKVPELVNSEIITILLLFKAV